MSHWVCIILWTIMCIYIVLVLVQSYSTGAHALEEVRDATEKIKESKYNNNDNNENSSNLQTYTTSNNNKRDVYTPTNTRHSEALIEERFDYLANMTAASQNIRIRNLKYTKHTKHPLEPRERSKPYPEELITKNTIRIKHIERSVLPICRDRSGKVCTLCCNNICCEISEGWELLKYNVDNSNYYNKKDGKNGKNEYVTSSKALEWGNSISNSHIALSAVVTNNEDINNNKNGKSITIPQPIPYEEEKVLYFYDIADVSMTHRENRTPEISYLEELMITNRDKDVIFKNISSKSEKLIRSGAINGNSIIPVELWVPVAFTLISSDTSSQHLSISKEEIDRQLTVLNQAYYERTKIRFLAHSYRHFRNNTLSDSCQKDPCILSPETCPFYNILLPFVSSEANGGYSAIEVMNVIICDGLPFLGDSRKPWQSPEASPINYVLLSYRALSGKSSNRGELLTHLVGHYFGLLHTFGDGDSCDIDDYVNDTSNSNRQAEVTSSCDVITRSCPNKNNIIDSLTGEVLVGNATDDTNNYMNFADEHCVFYFTDGQSRRMEATIVRYRPRFLRHRLVKGRCPLTNIDNYNNSIYDITNNFGTNNNLEACVCADPDSSPLLFCGLDDPKNNNNAIVNTLSLFLWGSSKYTGPDWENNDNNNNDDGGSNNNQKSQTDNIFTVGVSVSIAFLVSLGIYVIIIISIRCYVDGIWWWRPRRGNWYSETNV